MSVFYRLHDRMIFVHGQTYPHRASIKSLGGRFLGEKKEWVLPVSRQRLEAIDLLCREAGGGPDPEAVSAQAEGFAEELDQKKTAPVDASPVLSEHGSDLSVQALLSRAGQLIEAGFPEPVWVVGEIQNLQERSGHLFLDLAEEAPQTRGQGTVTVRCTLWKDQLRMIEKKNGGKDSFRSSFQDGLKVRAFCQVRFYEGRGSLSLNILNIDPDFTKGALALARERLMKELRSRGLDVANKSCQMPPLPLKIGLISAENSRAYSDFVHQLESGGFPGQLLFISCYMQGEKTPGSVSRAMDTLVAQNCDLIVITRGGGSAADLRWFDDRSLALKLASLRVPVLAAIGHHDDRCVLEEICFMRQKTPTAAADFLLLRLQDIRNFLNESLHRLERRTAETMESASSVLAGYLTQLRQLAGAGIRYGELRIRQHQERLRGAGDHILRRYDKELMGFRFRMEGAFSGMLGRTEQKLSHLKQNMQGEAERVLRERERSLDCVRNHLVAHDPSPWMKKGWTRLQDPESGKACLSAEAVRQSAVVQARFLDGWVRLAAVTQDDQKNQDHIQKEL
ncbi:MAG: exodeoxyribonuclease VII large subunit [Deltaproteobacteria bacterium]|nr:exodeoxyribonuclease VII large subunit [Deltaproteobacteria bacterium]